MTHDYDYDLTYRQNNELAINEIRYCYEKKKIKEMHLSEYNEGLLLNQAHKRWNIEYERIKKSV